MPVPLRPRNFDQRVVELRADQAGAGFDGYASTWWAVDAYGTAMAPGAFAKSLRKRDGKVSILWQHDPFSPIGRPTVLKEDDTGLRFRAEIVEDVRAGAEAMALLRAGVPLGMSFGFETLKSRPVEDADSDKLDWSQAPAHLKGKEGRALARVIEEVTLWEVSLVTFPANEDAAVTAVRSDDSALLSSLLADLRAGTLDPERRALVQQIVHASHHATAPDRPQPDGAGPGHGSPVEAAAMGAHAWASFDLHAAFALERARLTLAGVHL